MVEATFTRKLFIISPEIKTSEQGIFAYPAKLHVIGLSVTVFRNYTLSHRLVAIIAVVSVTIEEHDDISVLLNRTSFSQV